VNFGVEEVRMRVTLPDGLGALADAPALVDLLGETEMPAAAAGVPVPAGSARVLAPAGAAP
jgi:hypothetical protein